MKSNKKKFAAALAMLLVSVLTLSTATFAWFSMSTSVTATGMTVTAKSNATYLIIGDSTMETAAKVQEANELTQAATSASATIYPSAYNQEGSALTVTSEYSAPAGTWYTANNGIYDEAMSAVKDAKPVDEADEDYMLTNEFYITLSKDSEDYTQDLKVTYKLVSGDVAISAVVIINDGTNDHIYDFTANGESRQFTCATKLTKEKVYKVTVYTYVNGESANVNSKYVATNTITGEMSLTFDLVDTPASETP